MSQVTEPPVSPTKRNPVLQWLGVVLLVYLLVVAVGMIGAGFKSATGERAEELFAFATNPFMGLIVGTVATALIQSSSTVSSIIVGLVAGGLPVATAVPMIMGANIGTTITNTLVSLGHVTDKTEFRKAFAAATIHDFFNLLSVVIFLPLEILFHPLERMGLFLANIFVGGGSASMKNLNVVKTATSPLVNLFKAATHIFPAPFDGILLIFLGIGLIFLTITFIGKLLKVLMVGRAKDILHTAIGRGPIAGILAGTLITILVQSSSTTTSLMVPLAGAGVFGLAQVYPFTLGANIGTCVTALLAATAVSGAEAVPALEIAMVHLLYNTLGVIVIYGIPFLCRLPIVGAETLAAIAADRKYLAFLYIVTVFFLIPGMLLGLTALA
ncbi:MAG: Na/Pi symporter [Cyanobacteria bacterium P01_E01_bin.43]